MALHPVLRQKLNVALAPIRPEAATRRDAELPPLPGKVHAVIGMRRTGKTTFLRQRLADLRAELPPERALYLSLDDDRLADLKAEDLGLLFEEHFRRFPDLRGQVPVHWMLDEIQVVEGWDRLMRRLLDTEQVEIVVSGSSAGMLSRDVSTSLRGRGFATVIRPFSFREFLRHRGEEPSQAAGDWTPAERSRVEKQFRDYLIEGGFPEVQGLRPPLRVELLQSYVDAVLFRDVVERHGVTQVAALRWLVRHCLRNPAGSLSVHGLHRDLRSQGLGVAKDAVHEMLGYFLDAFLLSAVPLATESERRRNSNPRKIYPADPGFIKAFDASGRSQLGHALETVVLNELERRRAELGYVKTEKGFEVDFLVRYPAAGDEELMQVCADPSADGVLDRELRALAAASAEWPRARQRLLVLGHEEAAHVRAPQVDVQPVYEWLLEDRGEG